MNSSNATSVVDAELLEFLNQPASYPHHPEQVEHIQTHISHVFIAPPFVYKIKKPVNFEFLDYRSLDKRKFYCRREVELNRRLCSEIYLGVTPVYKTANGFTFDAADGGDPVEYAVKMKKLEDRYFLHNLLENRGLDKVQLDRVADKLASFYNRQEPDREVLEYGSIDKIRVNTNENFDQTKPFIGDTIDRMQWEVIKRFTDGYFEHHEELFEKRVAQLRIVDGHGDLHLEHIHIKPDRICIYDCIEFNDRFRYQDLANDIAYLAMDLDLNDCRHLSDHFIEVMAGRLDDQDLHKMIDFYKCYRAYVRGKVKSMESSEEEILEEHREKAAGEARRYFDLSLEYALLGSGPMAVIFMGRVASGKSTLAGWLSEKLHLNCYSSDRIRKRIAGIPLNKRPSEEVREHLYSPEMHDRTYSKLFEHLAKRISQGESVILDATFNRKAARAEIRKKLESAGIPYLFIQSIAPENLLRKRLKKRDEQEEAVSDARLEDYEMLEERFEPPREIEQLLRVNTDCSLEESIHQLYEQLVERHLQQVE
ncbi:MAG: AAA family ATPase [Balneolaceae bacterium]|nr:AAA family ATPase [Balneolaceae bacterium]